LKKKHKEEGKLDDVEERSDRKLEDKLLSQDFNPNN
jgi:hypothetical protein